MDEKYSVYGQIPPELQKKLCISGEGGFIDAEKLKRRLRFYMILGFLPFIIIGGLIASIFIFPYHFASFFELFDAGPIKGTMYDMTYVPDESGKGKSWLVTNPSFTYVQTVETPGSYSMSTECVGCKIRLYIYDQYQNKVVSQTDMPLRGIPYDADLYYHDGAVWLTARNSSENAPFIYKYDAATGKEIYNTQSFVTAKEELTASIIELSQTEDPYRLSFKLADGKEFIYLVDEDKFFAGNTEFLNYFKNDTTMTVFGLTQESSDTRTILYSITGPAKKVLGPTCFSNADDAESLMFFCEATSKKISDEVFLDAFVLYQDNEMAVIFHHDTLGNDAKRKISAYNIDGEKLWTIPQEQLFREIEYDPQDVFTQKNFVKSHIAAEREGNVFVFIVDQVGAAGFDTATGEQLWKIIP